MADLLIRRLDPRDDADMDGFQGVYAAAELAEDPDAGLYSREDGISMLTSDDESSLFEAFGGFMGDLMVGETILLGSTRDNLQVAQLLLWIDPAYQRRGHGARMLAHAEDHARSIGRTVLRVQSRIGDGHTGDQRFAERHGFALAMVEIERRLQLPVDAAMLDRLEAETSPHLGDYEVRTVIGRTPAELKASYIELRNLMGVEMPHGDLDIEPGRMTTTDLDALETERESAGRNAVRAFAVRDGVVVAYADASVPGGDARHIDQFGTLVHPEHRGHRLGMAVKCAQLRAIAEHFPDREHIWTSNAETNAHMVAINEALGFAVHQVWGEFEKRLG